MSAEFKRSAGLGLLILSMCVCTWLCLSYAIAVDTAAEIYSRSLR